VDIDKVGSITNCKPTRISDSSGTNIKKERIFVHPSSTLFTVGDFECPWVVFYQKVKTSKAYVR